jgi:hypothetical protein
MGGVHRDAVPLTRTENGVERFAWSPDGNTIRVVMRHNLEWFNHYIWGDPLPDFTNPDVPKKEKKE